MLHVIVLAKLHDMNLYKTATFLHQLLKSVSKVAFLHRFHCACFYWGLDSVVLFFWNRVHAILLESSVLKDFIWKNVFNSFLSRIGPFWAIKGSNRGQWASVFGD